MEPCYWTVGKIADALERLKLTHQHAILDSVRILQQPASAKLVLMVREKEGKEPEEIHWGPNGILEIRRQATAA